MVLVPIDEVADPTVTTGGINVQFGGNAFRAQRIVEHRTVSRRNHFVVAAQRDETRRSSGSMSRGGNDVPLGRKPPDQIFGRIFAHQVIAASPVRESVLHRNHRIDQYPEIGTRVTEFEQRQAEAARCPPAEKPMTPTWHGSIPHSAAFSRTVRNIRRTSVSGISLCPFGIR